jgi:hypothetical protein
VKTHQSLCHSLIAEECVYEMLTKREFSQKFVRNYILCVVFYWNAAESCNCVGGAFNLLLISNWIFGTFKYVRTHVRGEIFQYSSRKVCVCRLVLIHTR